MECISTLFKIVNINLLEIFGKHWLRKLGLFLTWALHIIWRLMAKPNEWINRLSVSWDALSMPTPASGPSGFPCVNSGTIQTGIQLWTNHHLKFFMGIAPGILGYQLQIWLLQLICSSGWKPGRLCNNQFENTCYVFSSEWNARLTNIARRGHLKWVTGCSSSSSHMCNRQWRTGQITNLHSSTLGLSSFWRKLERWLTGCSCQ